MSDGRQLVVVVGSGRSGTSVMSSVLRELGYKVPQPEVQADQTNPRGFGEPQWLVEFHNAALRKAVVQASDARPEAWARTSNLCYDAERLDRARTWLDGEFADSDHVLLKDPRILWFTSLWNVVAEDLGAEAVYLTMLRPPADVVKSKDFWYDMSLSPTNRAAGWVNTMLYTERATRGLKRAYVSFDSLLGDWTKTVGELDARLGLAPVANARSWSFVEADKIVDPSLARSRSTWEQLGVSPAIASIADRTWDALQPLVLDSGDHEQTYRVLEDLRVEYRVMYEAAENVAQSSILAAKRSGVAEGRKQAKSKAKPKKQPATATRTHRSSTLRLARVFPTSLRRLVPVRMRNAIVRHLP